MDVGSLFYRIRSKIGDAVRKYYRNNRERSRLTNRNFTIISNTCIAGKMYHDLGLKFLTPTINLYIKPEQFVKFCSKISYYLEQPVLPVYGNYKYPVGRIDDVYLYFKHYTSFEEAVKKWEERKARIRWDNLFVIMTDRLIDVERGGVYFCGDSVLDEFNKLTFANKMCFTAVRAPNESCFWLQEFSGKPCVGVITDIVNFFGDRMYQLSRFDYVKWLNNDKSK